MGLGADIAAARIAADISIEDLAAATRVRAGILTAIEADDFSMCGGDVYARGHLRSIARVLKADGDTWVRAFDAGYAEAPITVAQIFEAERVTGSRRRMSTTNITLLVSVVIAVGVGGVAVSLGGGDRPTDDVTVLLTPAPTATESASPQPTAEPLDSSTGALASADGVVVEMSLSGSSWIRMTDETGRVTYEGTLRAGDTRTFRADESLSMVLGNGAAVRLVVNGEDLGQAGGPGEVIRRTYAAAN